MVKTTKMFSICSFNLAKLTPATLGRSIGKLYMLHNYASHKTCTKLLVSYIYVYKYICVVIVHTSFLNHFKSNQIFADRGGTAEGWQDVVAPQPAHGWHESRQTLFWFLFDKTECDCACKFPIDLKPNGITVGFELIWK